MLDLTLAEVDRIDAAARANAEKSDCRDTVLLCAGFRALMEERDEAREWVERMQREARILTCVYCGHAYEPGTPNHGTQALTEHINVCSKHPLREAEAERDAARAALQETDDAICDGLLGGAPEWCRLSTGYAEAVLEKIRAALGKGAGCTERKYGT